MEKITIKNISSANVILSFEDLNFRRELIPGRSISLDRETYDEMIFDPGFNSLIGEHYIKVEGLDEDEHVVESSVYDRAALASMLDRQDITAFAKFIPAAAPAEKETIVQLAVEKKITNNAIVALIKKYCDVDIISAIHMQHQAEEN